MDALDLAKMRQDRRKHSVAVAQPRYPSTAPSPAILVTNPRPSAAVPAQSLNRPQTIRFTNPTFTGPRNARFSSATTLTPSSKTARRADSLVPPNARTRTQAAPRRKSTAGSLFQSRSWSIFWDPRFRATTREQSIDGATAVQDPEPGSICADGQEKHPSFIARCKQDKLMHVVLGMVLLVGGALIIAGVAWSVTHNNRVVEDKRDFVCGKGVAGGPKCAVHLKGGASKVGSADWVGGEVVDWWLQNHCVWRGKEEEWWCGSQIGQQEGKGDQVLPEGTWLEKAETEEEEAGSTTEQPAESAA